MEFRILSPCARTRDSLDGSGAVRWCPECKKNVHDFALLRRGEIEDLTSRAGVCGIIEREADGAMRTADPPAWPRLMRRQFLRWAAALGAVSMKLLPAQSLEAGKGGVRGVVVDVSGAPVGGARVSVDNWPAGVADSLGRFVLTSVTPGSRELTVESPGFKKLLRVAPVKAGDFFDAKALSLEVAMPMGHDVALPSPDLRPLQITPRPLPAGSVSGTTAPGAKVALMGSISRSVTAGRDGRFIIEDVPPGDYKLSIAPPRGGRAATLPISIGPAKLDLGRIAP